MQFRDHFLQHYEAISYCAGDPTDCGIIYINGSTFNIFRSLYETLKEIRNLDKERILWIDQICINQTDILERNSQVFVDERHL
jgi:hypothetical protein